MVDSIVISFLIVIVLLAGFTSVGLLDLASSWAAIDLDSDDMWYNTDPGTIVTIIGMPDDDDNQ